MGVDGRNTSYMFQSPGDAERLQMRFAWEQATRDSYSDLECVELPNLIADCTYIAEDLLQTRMGNDGITHTQSFRLDPDGLLLSVGLEEPAFTEEHRSVARAFTMWLIDHYPDLIAEEDAVFGTGDVARPVEEILADWMAAIDEFLPRTVDCESTWGAGLSGPKHLNRHPWRSSGDDVAHANITTVPRWAEWDWKNW